MTDADRTDKAEERENMYIMMFTLQSLQNYGLSVKKTVERSLDYLWEWYQESGEERYLLLAKQHMQAYVNMGFALNEQNQTIRDIIPSLTVAEIKNRCIPCVYWGTAIFVVVMKYSNLFFSFAFFWIVLILLLVMN